jgi:RimJ/RimL family protein N-acetyltransferase
MIATNTIRLTSRTNSFDPLHLAPFGEAELSRIMPVDLSLMPYMSQGAKQAFRKDPQYLLDVAASMSHILEWGIYDGDVQSDNFIGSIELCKSNAGTPEKPAYSAVVRELGTLVVRQAQGFGTRAKLALLGYAFEQTETLVVHSYTSERNYPAQRSLAKTGFTFEGLYDYMPYSQNAKTHMWHIALPSTHDVLVDDSTSLQHGYARYERLRQTVDISVED